MRTIIILISTFIFTSCSNSIGIENLEHAKLSFFELPNEVKKQVFKVNFIDLNKPNKYVMVTTKNNFLPWIYNTEIQRLSDRKIYKISSINHEYGEVFIILNEKLYIPNHYNIYESDSLSYKFTCYSLK